MNDFYTAAIVEQTENGLTAQLTFNAEHEIFKGHFPGQPVVPGGCMIEMTRELLTEATSKSFMLHKAAQVKFLQLVTPDVKLTCSLSWQKDDESLSVNAVINADKAVFKMSAIYLER